MSHEPQPLTDHEAQELLRALIVDLSGLDDDVVRIGYQDVIRPVEAWISLIPVQNINVGRSWRLPPGEGVATATTRSVREATWEIRAYGHDACNALHEIAALLLSDALEVVTMVLAGLGIRRVSEVRTTSAPKGPTYEPRATVTVIGTYIRDHSATVLGEADRIVVDIDPAAIVGGSSLTIADAVIEPEPEPAP